MKTVDVTAISAGATDEHLVAAAQGGSSEAFSILFRRYRPEIARYAGRTLGDDGSAEDVVQETFLSALRSIGSLDRPEGLKPWLYRIAHNACVDQMRRRGRADEVPIDAHRLPAAEEIRLFRQAPGTDTALAQKENFRHLRQALGDLPEAQAQILVLRELEGLSYEEIAVRMGISHSAVESMLFRARRSLRDEFGEISTGERCRSMRALMAQVVEGVGRRKDRRALVRHLAGCQECRRDAFVMGLGPLVDVDRGPGLRAGLSRVAALLPLPGFLYRRPEGTDQISSSTAGGGGVSIATHAQTAISHVSVTAGSSVEHAATVMQKAAAVVAAAAVVGGGGFVAGDERTPLAPAPAVAKHMRDTRAPGIVAARPGAIFTSQLPLSLAPLAAGPPVVGQPAPAAPAAPVAPATTQSPAATQSPPATPSPAATQSPVTSQSPPGAASPAEGNSTAADKTGKFDLSSSTPDPPAEIEVIVETVIPEVPAEPPAPAPEPEPVAPDPPTGGEQPPPDQPDQDSGGSGPLD